MGRCVGAGKVFGLLVPAFRLRLAGVLCGSGWISVKMAALDGVPSAEGRDVGDKGDCGGEGGCFGS